MGSDSLPVDFECPVILPVSLSSGSGPKPIPAAAIQDVHESDKTFDVLLGEGHAASAPG